MEESFNSENIEFKPFNPLTCPREEWALFHEFRKIRHENINPDDPYTEDSMMEKSLMAQVQHPEFEIELTALIDSSTSKYVGQMMCGIFRETSASYEGNKHVMQFDAMLLPKYRRLGIGTNMLNRILTFAQEKDKLVLIAGSEEEDGKAFLNAIGAQIAQTGAENRLKFDDIDWKMVNEWMTQGPKRSPGTDMKLFFSIPDDIIDEYAKVFTETLNQQPLGDLDINDIIFTPESIRKDEEQQSSLGRTKLTYLTIESDGKISGLTEMLYRSDRKTMVTQLLTGVKQEYRGRGLGKWLKAAMLLKTKEDYPEAKIITTANATENKPMLSINDRLGFKLHKESISAQIKREDLEKYLKGK
ncbi:MAG: GNAT family N-acetyltransferase [Candidatus Heimdallarchaeaceae archaeon]